MTPILKTFVFALIAAGTSLVAAFYYPWPEVVEQSEIVGQPLFKNLTNEKIKKLEILRFNQQSGQLDSIQIQLSKDGWVLPRFKNFPVTNASQNGVTINSFDNRTVLLEETDDSGRHAEYGVVDPSQYKSVTDRSTLGLKIRAMGDSGNELASMIVGKTVQESRPNEFGELQHYVVLPGKPAVYVVNLNPRAFPTEFDRWVDPNLFSIPFGPIPLKIQITHALQPPEDFGKKEPQRIYRVRLNGNTTNPDVNIQREAASSQLELVQLELPGSDGKFTVVEKVPEFPVTTWNDLNLTLRRTRFTSVKKKTDELAKMFSQPKEDDGTDLLESLRAVGFNHQGFANGMHQFQSSKGQIELLFERGVRFRLMLGTLALETTTDQNELNRHVMLTAEFDEKLMPKLSEEPTNGTEEEKKKYLRDVKTREEMAKQSKELVASFNDRHASWVYLVPETICNRLVPDLDVAEADDPTPENDDPTPENDDPTPENDDPTPENDDSAPKKDDSTSSEEDSKGQEGKGKPESPEASDG